MGHVLPNTDTVQREIFAGCKFLRFSRTDQLPRKYKPRKNEPRWNWWRHYVIQIGTCVNEMVLYSLSATKIMSSLWIVAAKQTQPATMCTKYQWTRKRRSEVVEFKISSAESFCSTSQFFACAGMQSWYFRNREGLHTKGWVDRCCTSLLRFVVWSLVHVHMGRGHHL